MLKTLYKIHNGIISIWTICLVPLAEDSKVLLRIGMMLGYNSTILIGEGQLWWPIKQADYPYAKLAVENLVLCNPNIFGCT